MVIFIHGKPRIRVKVKLDVLVSYTSYNQHT